MLLVGLLYYLCVTEGVGKRIDLSLSNCHNYNCKCRFNFNFFYITSASIHCYVDSLSRLLLHYRAYADKRHSPNIRSNCVLYCCFPPRLL